MRNSVPNFEEFLRRWRIEFRQRHLKWEGPSAIQELQRSDLYRDFIIAKGKFSSLALRMLRAILSEVHDYEKRKRAWTKEFAETEYFLANIQRNASRRSKKVEDPLLQRFLKETAEHLEHRKAVLNRFRHGCGQSPLGDLEWFFRKHPRRTAVRGIDLDTRLQIQLAKAFRAFLRKEMGISTVTIARLIVLVYIVCDLPVVSVRSVYEKLERLKLPARSVQTDPRTLSFFELLAPKVQEALLDDWKHPSGSRRKKLRSSDIPEDC